MTVHIQIPQEGVTVIPHCPYCEEPVARTGGSVSWCCGNRNCSVKRIPMWEDAMFLDTAGQVWVPSEDEDEWFPVVQE